MVRFSQSQSQGQSTSNHQLQHDGVLPPTGNIDNHAIEEEETDWKQAFRPMEIGHGSVCHYSVRADCLVLRVDFLGQAYTPGGLLLAVAA